MSSRAVDFLAVEPLIPTIRVRTESARWSCPPEGWRGLAAFAQNILDVFEMLRENYDAKLDSRASRVFMECEVAGLSHVDDLEGRLQGSGVGSGLMLRRDSTNDYDAKAIEVLNDAGERIGFVPRTDNSSLAGLMDKGLHFTARVQSLTGSGRHSRRLRILVFCERDAQRYFKDIERIEGTHV